MNVRVNDSQCMPSSVRPATNWPLFSIKTYLPREPMIYMTSLRKDVLCFINILLYIITATFKDLSMSHVFRLNKIKKKVST